MPRTNGNPGAYKSKNYFVFAINDVLRLCERVFLIYSPPP